MKFVFGLILLLLVLQQRLQADNWPCWRGPSYDGITQETNIPKHWSSTENVYWRIPIDGVGHSSPIVWEDAIFLTTCNLETKSRQLLRVDRETGKILWTSQLATAPIEQMHRDNTPASATPVTDGVHVFVVFAVNNTLLVAAVDFKGNVAWSRSVGDFEASHGFCSSLVLDGSSLYLSGLQDGADAFLACIDKVSGETEWKVPRTKPVRSYSTPFLCNVRGAPAVLLSGADQTIAYDRLTGSTIWEIDGPGSKTVSSVVISREADMAYVCGGRDNKFLAIDLHNINSVATDVPRIAWTANKGIPYMTSPLFTRGTLHILSDEGIYSSYEPSTGKVLCQRRAVGAVKASMIANHDYIYITEVSGKTTVIRNEADWNVVAQNDLGESIVASPAVSNGDIVLRGEQHLFLIRNKD